MQNSGEVDCGEWDIMWDLLTTAKKWMNRAQQLASDAAYEAFDRSNVANRELVQLETELASVTDKRRSDELRGKLEPARAAAARAQQLRESCQYEPLFKDECVALVQKP
jgi:hypothetical protein